MKKLIIGGLLVTGLLLTATSASAHDRYNRFTPAVPYHNAQIIRPLPPPYIPGVQPHEVVRLPDDYRPGSQWVWVQEQPRIFVPAYPLPRSIDRRVWRHHRHHH